MDQRTEYICSLCPAPCFESASELELRQHLRAHHGVRVEVFGVRGLFHLDGRDGAARQLARLTGEGGRELGVKIWSCGHFAQQPAAQRARWLRAIGEARARLGR